MPIELLVLIILSAITLTVLIVIFSILFPIKIRNRKYQTFVNNHSRAISQLKRINNIYSFCEIKNCDLEHTYDNEKMYDEISCTDYLIYELAYRYKKIIDNMNNTFYNKEQYLNYLDQVNIVKCGGEFDEDISKYKIDKLLKTEKQVFNDLKKKPCIEFQLAVTLNYRNMANRLIDHKYKIYYPKDISELFREVRNKRAGFYLNEKIWAAICRVERGKVTNKMRFAIYARDGHRCKMCGRYSDNLEIDHIIPISKGGKSTMNNLQTLCHSCNKKKGTDIY